MSCRDVRPYHRGRWPRRPKRAHGQIVTFGNPPRPARNRLTALPRTRRTAKRRHAAAAIRREARSGRPGGQGEAPDGPFFSPGTGPGAPVERGHLSWRVGHGCDRGLRSAMAPGLRAAGCAARSRRRHPTSASCAWAERALAQAEDILHRLRRLMETRRGPSVVPFDGGWSDLGGRETVWREDLGPDAGRGRHQRPGACHRLPRHAAARRGRGGRC